MARPRVMEEGRIAQDPVRILRPIRDRIRQAREHRKQFEPTWQVNLAFASGKHWLAWDREWRTLRRIQDIDPAYKGRELYTADLITEYRTTVLGELGSDDDRPELLLQRDDTASEDFQQQVNRALGYGWDFEFDADEALAEVDRMMLDLGTAGMRCRFDPGFGDVLAENIPTQNGRPVFDMEQATELMGGGPRPDVAMQDIRQGRIVWEPLSSFNLLPPPGVTHERYFPWECVVRPTPLSQVQEQFGEAAADLEEDGDIASTLGQEANTSTASPDGYARGESRETRLRDHVWVFTYYERPTERQPEGRVYHFASNDLKLLRVDERLPYKCPDGTYGSGISYFHWWRVTGRFWSRALVENLKDGQRTFDKRRTQMGEIIDRGLPYVLAAEGTNVERQGRAMDIVRYPRDGQVPTPVQGLGPGQWFNEEVQQIQQDMERSSGVRGPTLGENPSNVGTYSQLALLREADVVKREVMLRDRKMAIAKLVEFSVYDMRQYWGPEKQVTLAGDEDKVEAMIFNATKIPDFFIVKIAKGSAKPRTQAAEIAKIDQIWMAALNSGVVPLQPQAWIDWYTNSLEAGQVLEIPMADADDQHEKAELENHLLMQGENVQVAYYDPLEVHVPVHRSAQIECELSGDMAGVLRIEMHIQQHLGIARENIAAMQAETAAQMPPPMPGAPEAGPPSDQPPGAPEPQPASPIPVGG